MYLYWCNECGWEERMDKHKYDFCPQCGHVNISKSKNATARFEANTKHKKGAV